MYLNLIYAVILSLLQRRVIMDLLTPVRLPRPTLNILPCLIMNLLPLRFLDKPSGCEMPDPFNFVGFLSFSWFLNCFGCPCNLILLLILMIFLAWYVRRQDYWRAGTAYPMLLPKCTYASTSAQPQPHLNLQ